MLNHVYLQILPSRLAPAINSLLSVALFSAMFSASIPLVLIGYCLGTFSRYYWLKPSILGTLILRDGQWTLNGQIVSSPRFYLSLSHWLIAVNDESLQGWALIWRDGCEASAYRRLIVTIKKQSQQ